MSGKGTVLLVSTVTRESHEAACAWQESAIIDSMKNPTRGRQLVVRNIENEVVRALKLSAAQHGRSAEAEHREILRRALLPAKDHRSLKDLLLSMPDVGEDADFERIVDLGREVDF